MKSFKKVLSIFLAILCVFGMISTVAVAFDLGLGEDEDDPLNKLYGLYYEIDPYNTVPVMYKPSPTIVLNTPKIVEVSGDLPLAVDYEFYAWKTEDGTIYYPGEDIYVNGKITLYAEGRPKADNDSRFIRVIKTAFQTMIRSIQSFFGVFDVLAKDVPSTDPQPTTAPSTAPAGPSRPPVTEGENTTAAA